MANFEWGIHLDGFVPPSSPSYVRNLGKLSADIALDTDMSLAAMEDYVRRFKDYFNQLNTAVKSQLVLSLVSGVSRSSNKHINHVALKTGTLRNQLREMFRKQYEQYEKAFSSEMIINLDKTFPWAVDTKGKPYAQFHIMEWNIRDIWQGGRYRYQQTLAHLPQPFKIRRVKKVIDARPIFIEEILAEAGREVASQMINWWAKNNILVRFSI